MYTCVCICIYIYIHTHTYIYIHIYSFWLIILQYSLIDSLGFLFLFLGREQPYNLQIIIVVVLPFQYVYSFYPFSYLIMFWREWWYWRFPSSCFFPPPHVFSHHVCFQSMPITLHTVFQKLTAEFACVIWPSFINHHAPSGSPI